MNRFFILIIIVILIFIEIAKQLLSLIKLKEKEEFANEFHNKLLEYVETGGDDSLFLWLSKNAVKMQEYMGSFGITSYQPPFSNYYITNYMIIINGLDEVKKDFYIGYNQHFEIIRSSILKYLGSIDVKRNKIKSILRNPIRLLTSSIKSLLLLPLSTLYEFGILNSKIISVINNSNFAKSLSGIFSILFVLSAIVSLVLGWNEFVSILEKILNL